METVLTTVCVAVSITEPHGKPRVATWGAAGNNYSDNGVPEDLPSGGEALLHAEPLSMPDFVGVMNDVKNGEINTHAG